MGYLEIVVAKLLECSKDESRAVTQKTEEALECLLTTVEPPQRCVQVLIPIIISEDSPVLQVTLSCPHPPVYPLSHPPTVFPIEISR